MIGEPISVQSLGEHIELRIHGWGATGKGDRTQLLSAKDAKVLAYQLLIEAEECKVIAKRAA